MRNISILWIIVSLLALSTMGCDRYDRDQSLYQLATDYLAIKNQNEAEDILYPACRGRSRIDTGTEFLDFHESWNGWQNANLRVFIDDSNKITACAKKLAVKYSLNEHPVYFEIVVEFPKVTKSAYLWAVFSDRKYRILCDEELAMLDPHWLRDDASRREIGIGKEP